MLWHIVRFDTTDLPETGRAELVARLEALVDLDVVSWLRVAPDVDDPTVVGLLVGLRDRAALEAYRVHPDHVPVLDWVRASGIPVVRLDVATPDDVTSLA